MELDKRIIDGKKPLTCFDAEQAMQFIGKQCYFSDEATDFMDLDKADKVLNFRTAVLQHIWNEVEDCFGDNSDDFRFILPCEWVEEKKEPEKKYRPFSLNEFLERYKMGNTVTFRLKKGEYVPEAESLVEYQRMITGYEGLPEDRDKPGKGSILLGGCPPVSLARLFEFYELDNDFNWQPFGILEEE